MCVHNIYGFHEFGVSVDVCVQKVTLVSKYPVAAATLITTFTTMSLHC